MHRRYRKVSKNSQATLTRPKIAAIVLAVGQSSRTGEQNKLLAVIGDTPLMLHQFTPALLFYEQVSGVIGETVSAMTAGAGSYCQCAQFTPLIL